MNSINTDAFTASSSIEDGLLETTHAHYDDFIYWLQLGHLQGVDREIECFVEQQQDNKYECAGYGNKSGVSRCSFENHFNGNDNGNFVENGSNSTNVVSQDHVFELVRAEPFFLKDGSGDVDSEEDLLYWDTCQTMGNLQTGEKKPKGGGSGGGAGDGAHSNFDTNVSGTSHLGIKEKTTGSPRIMRMFSSAGKKNAASKVSTQPPPAPSQQAEVVQSPSTHSQLSPPTTLESTPFATPPSKDETMSDSSDAVFVDVAPSVTMPHEPSTAENGGSHIKFAAASQHQSKQPGNVLDLAQITLEEFDKSFLVDSSAVKMTLSPSAVTTAQSTTTASKIRNGNLASGNASGGEMRSWEERISAALQSNALTQARRQENSSSRSLGTPFASSSASLFSGRVSAEPEVITEAEEDQMGGTNGVLPEVTTVGATNGHTTNSRSHGFTITKHKKINLSPTTSPSSSTPATPATPGPPTTPLAETQPSSASLRRHSSYGDVPLGEQSNVLRKVASLTLDRATIEEKVNKPKFVPEKLDFKIYEKFEGQMLLNWFCSSFTEGHYLNNIIKHDLKIIAVQFCTHLLACGVLQQIEDADAPLESLFKPDRMYFWTHLEAPTTTSIIPGKIQESTKSLFLPDKVGDTSPISASKPNSAINGSCSEDIQVNEEIELLKNNYRQEIEKIQRENETVVARIQKERTTEMESLRERIQNLEREVDKYKTLADIQLLTRQVNDDFSPTNDASNEDTKPKHPPPPPPPMPGMGPPPPPPMPGMGPPPPPPMPGMGPPPPPPMPGMGPPPPPPMPGMGPPPPPPMPGMGPPPPPPIPGMGPPPPGTRVNGGPAPFPPPPPGGWGYEPQLRKPPISPKVPMKPLYWTRIQIISQPTSNEIERKDNIWEKVEEMKMETLEDFIDLFARQVVEKKVPAKTKVQKTSKVEPAKLLDGKRAQMVGILVSSHHLEIVDVENAVYNFDTSVLDLDSLQAIYEVRATDEELKQISYHLSSSPEVPLDRPEQFLYELSQIPHFADRIACFTFQSSFHESISAIENKLNNMQMTCEFLMKSDEIKNVLGLVLTLGNYMNGGNRQRGQADGFGLDILSKLKDVKSRDSSFTLLHYIVKVFVRKFDENAGTEKAKLPVPEPSDLDKAASVKFDDIQSDLKKLNQELNECEKRAARVIEVSDVDHLQPFKSNMEEFIEKGGVEMKEQEENLKSCISIFEKLTKVYQWNPKPGDEFQPKCFFATLTTFCADFKDAWKKEQQKVLKEKMEKLQKKVKDKSEIKVTPKEKTGLKWRLAKKQNR
ncbi:hypothetical protein CHUAL_003723 [Chamberlinius hualienensis]